MAAPKGFLVVPVGYNPDGDLRSLELDASDFLKVVESSGDLAKMVTALELIDDLRGALDSVGTDELDVNIESSVLPTGASTSAAQATAFTELQQKLETADLELVSKILSVGDHGWISGAWQRNPLSFGFSGTLKEKWEDLSLGAGVNTVDSGTVPAGEIWCITTFSWSYSGIAPTTVRLLLIMDGGAYEIQEWTTITQGVYYNLLAPIYLDEGDYIRFRLTGATLNDNFYGRAFGYRMDIDQ